MRCDGSLCSAEQVLQLLCCVLQCGICRSCDTGQKTRNCRVVLTACAQYVCHQVGMPVIHDMLPVGSQQTAFAALWARRQSKYKTNVALQQSFSFSGATSVNSVRLRERSALHERRILL